MECSTVESVAERTVLLILNRSAYTVLGILKPGQNKMSGKYERIRVENGDFNSSQTCFHSLFWTFYSVLVIHCTLVLYRYNFLIFCMEVLIIITVFRFKKTYCGHMKRNKEWHETSKMHFGCYPSSKII